MQPEKLGIGRTLSIRALNIYLALPKENKNRVDRYLIVAQAIDAYDEIPDVPHYEGDDPTPGRKFFKNDWYMGPFYSFDANYLQK